MVGLASRASADAMNVGAYSMAVYNDGPGVRLGSAPLKLHAGAAVDFGYDSNILYSYTAIAAGVMRFRLHLDLVTLSAEKAEGEVETEAPKIAFKFGSQLEYREYLTNQGGFSEGRNINVYADGALTILPRGPFTLTISDSFARTADPLNYEISQNLVRDINRAGFVAKGTPRGGQLEFGMGGYFQLNYYGESARYAFGSIYATEGQLFLRWYFLPKTRLSVVARGGYQDYPNNSSQNHAPMRVLAGFSTFFTNWLGAEISAGYGNSFHFQGVSYNNFIGSAAIQFHLPYRATIEARYERDFHESLIANFYRDDAFSLTYTQPLIYRITAQVGGAIRLRTYEGLIDPALIQATGYSSTEHYGPIYEAHADVNVDATKWLRCGVSYHFLKDTTDFVFYYSDHSAKDRYTKHSVFARLDFAY